MNALDLRLADAQRVLLWSTARNVLSPRPLGLAGTYEAQAMLAGLGPLLDEAHAACGELRPDALAQPRRSPTCYRHARPALLGLFQS